MKTDTKKYRVILSYGTKEIASWNQEQKPKAGLGENIKVPEEIMGKYPSINNEAVIFRIELNDEADVFYADLIREHELAS